MYSMLPSEGDVISGRYRIGELIGRGSMGVVYEALDEQEATCVAIKFLVVRDQSSKMVNRFFRGARLAQKIQHPHVVRTLGFGFRENAGGGPFLVMERVRGVPLTQLIGSDLSVAQSVGLTNQSLSALAHMHARGILHRDIKPDNLLVEQLVDGVLSVRVTDFGLAAAMEGDELVSLITAENIVVGTAAYMAPEQAVAASLSAPVSDLYAIGTILYEMIQGHRPFTGTALSVLIDKTRKDAPLLRPEPTIPEGLSKAVARLLAREPGDRFLTAADALRALRPFAETPRLLEFPSHVDDYSLAPTMGTEQSVHPSDWDLQAPPHVAVQFNNPLWGRDELVDQVSSITQQTEAGAGCALLLQSHIGVEATVIADHLSVSLAEKGRFIILRGGFHEIAGAEGGLRQALEGYWRTHGLSRDLLKPTVIAHLARHEVTSETELDEVLNFLRPGHGSSPPAGRRQNELFAVFFRILRRLASEKPVCLILDDLHRGGPLAAAFLEYSLFELSYSPFPFLLMGTAAAHRSNDALTESLGRSQSHRDRSLCQLTVPPIEESILAEALCAQAGLTTEMANHVARVSGGSPVVARQLAEVYLRADDSGEYSVGSSADLPPALTNVLMRSVEARINAHSNGETLRFILSTFSVLGAAVEYQLLRTTVGAAMTDEKFDTSLGDLLDLDIVTTKPYDNEELFFLSPSSLRDLLLEQQPQHTSHSLHERAIKARLALAGEHSERVSGFIADHYAAMNREDMALEYWLQASAFETEQGDPVEGANWGAKALNLMNADDPRGVKCALTLGQTLLDLGHLSRAAELLAPFVENANADGAMIVGEVLADVYENQGDSAAWQQLVDSLTTRLADTQAVGKRAFMRTRAMWQNSYGRSRAGLSDAVQALKMAPPGPEAQRAAQRAVYCCLALNAPADGEPYARTALKEAGGDPSLRVRSLRALGTVLTWLGRGEESIALHTEALELCRLTGLNARIPIAYHDLGDAHRMAGQGAEAEEAYAMALHCADEFSMGHTVALVKVKQVMSALTDGRTEGVVKRLQRLAPEALDAGLGLALPFCSLLEAWAYSLRGDHLLARSALEAAGDIAKISVDPQVPDIVNFIEERLL